MERSEGQLKSKELTDDEITLVNQASGEFLQADQEQLINWILSLLTERGKEKFLQRINKSAEWRSRMAFASYLYQKSKDEREKMLVVFKKLPENNGFIGLGGSHAIFSGITPFVGMINQDRTAGRNINFKELPEDF